MFTIRDNLKQKTKKMAKSHGLYRIDIVRTIIIIIYDDDIIHSTVKKYMFIKINLRIFFNNTK